MAHHERDLVIEGIVENAAGGARVITDYLARRLRWPGGQLPEAFVRLPRMGFSAVITTNFDDLLEHALAIPPDRVYTLADTGQLLEAIAKNAFFLLKLYGDLRRSETVILTSARYRDAVVGNEVFGQFLRALFYSRMLLFAGKGLEGIEEFLASVPSRSDAPPRHFAAVPDNEPGIAVRASSLKRRFGIELIPCPYRSDGGAIAGFLEQLEARVTAAVPATAAHGPPSAAQSQAAHRVRLELENIGPFEQLAIDLDPGWTLLLGDNGVGKSSLLKSIAVAIVGRDAAPFATRLVRDKATAAAITLTTSRADTYRTEIVRSESTPIVNSIPVRPLEKEGCSTSTTTSRAAARPRS